MNYKKIIAASAVTSAAFIAPMVAQAEEIVVIERDILLDAVYSYGGQIKIDLTEIALDDQTSEKITKYEWIIVDGTHETKLSETTNKLTIPIAANGKEIKVVITTESGAKYTDSAAINALTEATVKFKDDEGKELTSDKYLVNSSIYASDFKVGQGEVVTGYQWYIVNENSYELLTGETDSDIDIPLKASGKHLMLVLATKENHYYASTVKVMPLEIKEDFEVKFLVDGKDQNSTNLALVPGDKLSIKNFAVMGTNGELLTSSQYEITYQWYVINDSESKILLTDATSSSYTIPLDSEKKGYKRFSVDVTITIPSIEKSYPVTGIAELNADPTSDLINYISRIVNSSTKEYAADFLGSDFKPEEVKEFDKFKANVSFLNTKYKNLSTNSQKLITNYAVLQQANQDIQMVAPLISELEKFSQAKVAYEDSKLKHADLLKQFSKIQSSYNKLTKLQRSLLAFTEFNNNYVDAMQDWLKKSEVSTGGSSSEYLTYQKIGDINEEISKFIDIYNKEYSFDGTLEEFSTEVKTLLSKASAIEKTYLPLINTTILKTAQNDIKKAQKVIDALNKISTITDPKKKTTAIVAAQKAYNNLNPYQASLITDLTNLKPSEEAKENLELITELIDRIKDLKPLQEYNLDIVSLEIELDEIQSIYKTLSSTDKKLVTNYAVVNQVKKDLNVAKKVAIAINNAYLIHEEAKEASDEKQKLKALKSAQSKYASAYKAYVKLTKLQQSILLEDNDFLEESIDSFLGYYAELTELVKTPEFKDTDEKADEKFDESKVSEVISLIESIDGILASPDNKLSELEGAINAAKVGYKALTSYEKKRIYNYSLISSANSTLTKAKSEQKKLQTAIATNDLKKITSAITSYNKLTNTQKALILAVYEQAQALIGADNVSTDDIADAIKALNMDYTATAIKEIQKSMALLSTKEQKAIVGYTTYQASLKDLKAVESFIAKMDKLGTSPTYSNKQSIFASYNKLTQKQVVLFESYEGTNESPAEMLSAWMEGLDTNAKTLNSFIGDLIINGQYQDSKLNDSSPYSFTMVTGEGAAYLNSFDQFLKDVDAEYKKLDSKERKLITHYSFIKTAQNDLKAVRKVVELEEQVVAEKNNNDDDNTESAKVLALKKQWEQAYNRLTVQQQSLYSLTSPTLP